MDIIMCFVMVAAVGVALVFLPGVIQRASQPAPPFIRALLNAGIRPGEREKILASGAYWRSQYNLMTPREVRFMQDLFVQVDMRRWHLCPRVRVADIVELSAAVRPRTKMWWRLFNMVSQWHCDVVVVDKQTFRIVAAIELDDTSHLKKHRVRRDIILEEVMRQADIPLLRDRDSQVLIQSVCRLLDEKAGNDKAENEDVGERH
ncbi:DUF2726 domain-containing protein (plasmid) [Klebsiella michiganensis]|uniref:DUF2726 domain-containing protein n=1 Tax=Klebsiella michiganensis TaxID=1134687 RepID=A0A6P1V4T3_9ENTR|nr:DUF2726 domain-containing protein [Klebsiella michiganensis]QHS50151.1 DUF2726 domain-containing protein [Klebsiella michiganensis]